MSSDQPYTLHTDQVRGRYSDGATYQGVEVAYMDEHLDAFDAWLARVRRDAAANALYEVATDINNYDDYLMVHNRAKRIEETP